MNTLPALVMGFFLLTPFTQTHSYHANALVHPIINFPQLVQAVENGQDVRAIIHFNHCLVTSPDTQDEVTSLLEGGSAGFKFTEFFHVRNSVNERQMDSVSTFKKTIIESASGEWLTLGSRLSVFEDNTARLRVVVYDPISNKKRCVVDWLCPLSTVQNGFQPIIQANFQNTIQSNIQNNVQPFYNSVPTSFQNNAESLSSTVLPNNNLVNPLQNTYQVNSGLVLFNYY